MPSSCWEWEAELDAAEGLLHNQSNKASLEDELELLPPTAEQASKELLPSASVQGITEGGAEGRTAEHTLLFLHPQITAISCSEAGGSSTFDTCSAAGGSSSSSSSNGACCDLWMKEQKGMFSYSILCPPFSNPLDRSRR